MAASTRNRPTKIAEHAGEREEVEKVYNVPDQNSRGTSQHRKGFLPGKGNRNSEKWSQKQQGYKKVKKKNVEAGAVAPFRKGKLVTNWA